MILFPAIDLKGGACVRLLHGEMSAATVFNDDPAAQARDFAAAGFEWLHVVDLDGAFAGRSVNGTAVAAIVAATKLKVQLGGGIRNEAQIAAWLDHGINRVVLGTVALRDPALVKTACRTHPGRVVVGIDARRGRVAVEGWAETSEVSARELALRFEDAGVAAIVYTDIDRDGALAGVNVEATAALAADLTTPVIASGGVASLDDLKKLKAREADGIAGVICGRALYDGRIDPARALSVLRDPRPADRVPAC
jgi:phosphoribosylformimino-5-aminoimidazole carboxamide ribotide isomerase